MPPQEDSAAAAAAAAAEDSAAQQLDLFVEFDQVLALIADLPQTASTPSFEKSHERYAEILSRYQEQPHLLDPHMEQLLEPLLEYVRRGPAERRLQQAAFKYMYQLCKVRTFKVLVKSLPHEIHDLEFVLGCVEQTTNDAGSEGGDQSAAAEWETRYMLLLWLSILVLNPFELARLDGASGRSEGSQATIAGRLFDVCVRHTDSSDTCSRAAAFLASRFLTRIDTKDVFLPRYLAAICTAEKGPRTGQLDAIAAILKHGKREDLLPHTDGLLAWVLASGYKESGDYLQSKQFVKIVQRVGLVVLRPRLAQWRYQRGTRSLVANLQTGAGREAGGVSCNDYGAGSLEVGDAPMEMAEGVAEEEIHVPDSVEDVIEELLLALRSASGEVRWSAAKGLGRVCGRLPRELGDEVVGSVIEILNPLEPHEAWHGGCLAIAELSKRGLLLPERLAVMVDVLQQALIYDEMRGYMSVGQHIRDAACYVAWAFARAYEPRVLEPFVGRIAAGLIVTTVFDREINCRRAASAAFQESVGRLGTFPHGIDILTEADFFAVGVRSRAFLRVADFVAQFEEYRQPLVDHLVQLKVGHWDTAIRELTARTLHALTRHTADYMAAVVLPQLFTATTSIDVNLRHGATIALGEIVRALTDMQAAASATIWLTADLVRQLNELVPAFLRRDQFRGHSGDIMRACCCDFIRNCSLARVDATVECVAAWQTVIDGCVTRNSAALREAGVQALAALAECHYIGRSAADNRALVERLLRQAADDLDEHVRMGCVSALGALPRGLLQPMLAEVLGELIKHAVKPRPVGGVLSTTDKWAEPRRDAIHALGGIVGKFGGVEGVGGEMWERVMACMLVSLQEYTVDDRGDIGAYVREATMTELFTLITTCPSSSLSAEVIGEIMTGFCQQATEIIDRTRGLAGSLFCKMIHHSPRIPHIPQHDALLALFPSDPTTVLWIYADQTFPIFCRLLLHPVYSPRLLLGLSASMGKLSESLVKHASSALFQFIHRHPAEVPRLCREIIAIFSANLQNDPISHPLLNFLDTLLASGTVTAELVGSESTFADEIYRLCKLELKGQRKLYKIVSSIAVFCHLVQVPRLCTKVLSTLSIYLGQMHVHVRKCTATKLYDAILIHGDGCESLPAENLDEVLELLSETDWGAPLVEIRPIRNRLCELLGIKAPVLIAN